MGLTLTLESLGSRAARTASAGTSGIRRIALNATSTGNNDSGDITSIYNAIEKFGQGLMRGTLSFFSNILTFDWKAAWGQCVKGFLFIANFNWNATDAQLDAQIKQAEIGLAAAKGRLAGQSLGYAICGFLPAATIAVFNEPMALYILKEVGEEAAEEISQSLANLVQLQFQQQSRTAFINLYKNFRGLLRGAAKGVAQTLVAGGILSQESVDKMDKNRNEPWSFASALDDTVDEIKDPIDKAYAEEFWDELQDSCIDAGYLVAGGIDSYMASQRMANESFFGRERIIEITPNRALEPATGGTT